MDFLVECSWMDDPPIDEPKTLPSKSADLGLVWVLHVDDALNAQGSEVKMILTGLDGFYTEYALRFSFQATNNQAEYEALLTGLKLTEQLGAKHLTVFTDSQLIVGQTTEEYEARDSTLVKYLDKAMALKIKFQRFTISHIPRCKNARADVLS